MISLSEGLKRTMVQKSVYLNPHPPDAVIYRQLLQEAENFVRPQQLTPPLTLDELNLLTNRLLDQKEQFLPWRDWLMVMIHNAVWRDNVATVPYHRRILLLPQCLRHSQSCQAPVDEYGLLCQGCGACDIQRLQDEAEELGMMCMVAEGSTVVADLLESGQVDAVFGVSCLDALEKSFPYMVKHAVPGLAFPLFGDGCKDTTTDMDMVCQAFRRKVGEYQPQLPIKALSQMVQDWFAPQTLDILLGPCQSQTDILAREWLMRGGQRFRPFLVVAVAHSLGHEGLQADLALQQLALAVECFHKASLIHDDIEDNDDVRYGQSTLHEEWGIPIALNIGDFLLGEGYRLIAEMDITPRQREQLLHIAATRHLTLCRGQGEDLLAHNQSKGMSIVDTLQILCQKTAPAFEVALLFGAVYRHGSQELQDLLKRFSQSLGVAYQIRDDLEDDLSGQDQQHQRLSVIRALKNNPDGTPLSVQRQAWELYEQHRNQTLRILQPIQNSALKRLFFQITMRILHDVPEPAKPFA
jgi:geranylgeranyl diphosphate synthase type II